MAFAISRRSDDHVGLDERAHRASDAREGCRGTRARARPHRARERARASPMVVSRRRRSIGTRRDFIGDLRRVASEDARDRRLTAKITITRVGSTFQRAKRGGRARECERRRRSGEGVRGGARADARDDVRGAGVGHDGDVAGGAKRGRSVCGKGEVHES